MTQAKTENEIMSILINIVIIILLLFAGFLGFELGRSAEKIEQQNLIKEHGFGEYYLDDEDVRHFRFKITDSTNTIKTKGNE